MILKTNLIKIAKIKNTFGVNGKVKIISFTHPQKNIFNINPLYIINDTIKKIEIKYEGIYRNFFITSIKNINNINYAEKIIKQYIYIKKESLPKLNNEEFYWFQLLGMNVIKEDNEYYGKIEDIFFNGVYDVLIIKNNYNIKELVPCIYEKYIKNINMENNIITIKNI